MSAPAVLGILEVTDPTQWATSRKKRAAEEAAAAAAASGGAGPSSEAGGAAAPADEAPAAVKVKTEGAKRQRAADDEIVDLCE